MKVRNIFLFWLILSLSLHVTTILTLKYFSENKITEKQEEKPVEIVILETPSKTKDLARQIVEQEKQINNESDPNAKYLSQFNQRIIEQTKAQLSGRFTNSAGLGQKATTQKSIAQKNNPTQQKMEKSPEGSKIQKFMPKMDWSTIAERNSGGDGREASRTSDYLKDVKKGMETQLSTKQFLYYAYFKRIHVQIQNYWESSIKEKIEKISRQGRTIASNQNRVTKLLIILDSKGALKNIKVLSESGYQDLDNAGIEAFRTAAPFPNPPSGLIEKDGTVRIRYDFVIES